MKITKKANGEQTIKIDRREWESIGKIAGWDDDYFDGFDGDETSELDPAVEKMVNELEVEIPEGRGAMPDEIKKDKKYQKRDKAEWEAIREEKARAKAKEKAAKEKDRYQKFLEKEVYSKPPILDD